MHFKPFTIKDNTLFDHRTQPELLLAPTAIINSVGRLTLISPYSPQVSFYFTRATLEALHTAVGLVLEELEND